MYVFHFVLNKMLAIRVWTRGLARPYACVFYYYFVHTIRVPDCFEPRPKFQVMYDVLIDLVT